MTEEEKKEAYLKRLELIARDPVQALNESKASAPRQRRPRRKMPPKTVKQHVGEAVISSIRRWMAP